MKIRLTALGALVASVLVLPAGHATGQSLPPGQSSTPCQNPHPCIVRITPGRGHGGDLIDLSASGFPPDRHTYILMPCPSYMDPTWHTLHNFVWIRGPLTDSHGHFAGFLFKAPILTGMTSSKCQVVVSDVEDNLSFAAVGTTCPNLSSDEKDCQSSYKIVARGKRLGRCERSLCVQSVSATPKRFHAGLPEQIDVTGWPGARLDIVLSYPNKKDEHHIQHLDWLGRDSVTVTVPAATADQTRVRVTVHASLGWMKDTRTGSFIVTH